MRSVEQALYDAVHDFPGGAPALAPRMGMSFKTLENMADTRQDSHGWNLRRFRQAIGETKDLRPLHALCAEFGGVFVKTDVAGQGDDAVLAALARLGREFGEVCSTLHDALTDGRVTPKEYERFDAKLYEMNQVAADLRLRMAARVEHRPFIRAVAGADA